MKATPVRPLVECWPDDPNVRSIDDEFLFGDDLLVAPVFDLGLLAILSTPFLAGAGEVRLRVG